MRINHPFITAIQALENFLKAQRQAETDFPATLEKFRQSLPEKSRLRTMQDERLRTIFEAKKRKAEEATLKFSDEKKKIYQKYGRDIVEVLSGKPAPMSFETLTESVRQMKVKYQGLFSEAEYLKILAYVKIAYQSEQVGVPEEEALKLALMCGNLRGASNYLMEFAKANKTLIEAASKRGETFKLVHDACLFVIPHSDTDETVFKEWQALSQQRNNLVNPEFRVLLPIAGNLSQLVKENKTEANPILMEKLTNELNDIFNGCDVYLQKEDRLSTKLEDDIKRGKKVVLTQIDDSPAQYKLYYADQKRENLCEHLLTQSDIQSIENFDRLTFTTKLTKLGRYEKNVYLNDGIAEVVKKLGGYKPFEGQSSLRRRKSELFDEEVTFLDSQTRRISAIRVELAKKCYGNKALTQMTLDQLKAYYEVFLTSGEDYAYFVEQGLSPKDYQKFLQLNRNKVLDHIPDVLIDGEDFGHKGFYLKKIDVRNDVEAARAACLGKLTDCCQSLSGEAGESCAIHGLTSPEGGFYVVCRGDADDPKVTDIVCAQSWVWRSPTGAIVCDSVEAAPGYKHMVSMTTMIACLYDQMALELINKHDVPRVTVGANSGISRHIGVNSDSFDFFSPENPPTGYTAYRDSKRQRLIGDKNFPFFFYKYKGMEGEINTFLLELGKALGQKPITEEALTQFSAFIQFYFNNQTDINVVKLFDLFKQNIDESGVPLIDNSIKLRKILDNNDLSASEKDETIYNCILSGAPPAIGRDQNGNTLLMHACEKGNERLFNLLLEKHVDVTRVNKYGNSALYYAISNERLTFIPRLVGHGALINEMVNNSNNAFFNLNRTFLMKAIQEGKEALATCLIQQEGIDLHAKDRAGRTALIYAITNDNEKLIKQLLAIDTSELNVPVNGKTPLIHALKRKNEAIIRFLIQEGSKVNIHATTECSNPDNPLLYAVDTGDKSIVQLFLNEGAVVNNDVDARHWTLFMHAVRSDIPDIVELILETPSVDVNIPDSNQRTPLMVALERNNESIVNLILKRDGVDLNAKNANQKTVLMYAIETGNVDIVQYLLDKELDVNAQDNANKTPLMYAIEKGFDEIVALILAKKPNLDLKDASGKSYLILAIEQLKDGYWNSSNTAGKKRVFDLLLKHLDPNVRGPNEQTPLMFGVRYLNVKQFQSLLECGAHIDDIDEHKKTALMNAAENDNTDLAEILIKRGADLSLEDENGKTFVAYLDGQLLRKLLESDNLRIKEMLADSSNFTQDQINRLKKSFTHFEEKFQVEFFINHGASFTPEDIERIYSNGYLNKEIVVTLLESKNFVFHTKEGEAFLDKVFSQLSDDREQRWMSIHDWRQEKEQENHKIISTLLKHGLVLNQDQLSENGKIIRLMDYCFANGLNETVLGILDSIAKNGKPVYDAYYCRYQQSPQALSVEAVSDLFGKACASGFEKCSEKLLDMLIDQNIKMSGKRHARMFIAACEKGFVQSAEKLLDAAMQYKIKVQDHTMDNQMFVTACEKGLTQCALKFSDYHFYLNRQSFNEGLQAAMKGEHTELSEALMKEKKFEHTSLNAQTFFIACKNGYEALALSMLDRIDSGYLIEDTLLEPYKEAILSSESESSDSEDEYGLFFDTEESIDDVYTDYGSYYRNPYSFQYGDSYSGYSVSRSTQKPKVKETDQLSSRENLLLIACNTNCERVALKLTEDRISLDEKVLQKYTSPSLIAAMQKKQASFVQESLMTDV